MGAHDREITEGREETIEGGVILRFPGDWVGPLEDLVPFGPSADREPSPAAPDFWGEDSAALQDALEAPEEPTPSRRPPVMRSPAMRPPLRVRRWLLPAGAVLAAALFATATILGSRTSTPSRARGVTYAIANLPSLAPSANAVKHATARHRRVVTHSRRRSEPARPVQTSATQASPSSTATTTPSPTYHPSPASSTSATSSSGSGAQGSGAQGGGAFTLGGP